MSLVLKDRVKETTSTTGTDFVSLSGAVQGYQSFAAIGNGNTTYYCIQGVSDWEVGIGTYSSGMLTRDTVLASSNSNSLVPFGAGVKDVFCTYPASKSVNKDAGVLFGASNSASGLYATVLAGSGSSASGNYAIVGAGQSNTASGVRAGVFAGGNNVAAGSGAGILAGSSNIANAQLSTVVGGQGNTASGSGAFVGGGDTNTASATNSSVVGGYQNTASGNYSCVVSGTANTASAQDSVIVAGGLNNASGNLSTIINGSNHIADGVLSFISSGNRGRTKGITGFHAFPACDMPIASVTTQQGLLVLAVKTTNSTKTALRSNSSAASATNQLVLEDYSVVTVTGVVSAKDYTYGYAKGWTFSAVAKRDSGAATTTLIASNIVEVGEDSGASTWSIDVDVDTTTGVLFVKVTGQASRTISWIATLQTAEVTT